MKVKLIPFLVLLLTAVFILQLFLLSTPQTVTALPPRPTPTAVPPLSPIAPGAQIELHLSGSIGEEIWTVVQWQDAQNAWHDIPGWQGELDTGSSKTWWVGQELLGSGPFRWGVVAGDDTAVYSQPFTMPTALNEKLIVTIHLE